MNELELTQSLIDVNVVITNILRSQINQCEMISELRDRIVELEKERK